MIKGSRSVIALNSVHGELKRLIHAVAEETDLIVIEGHRGEEKQNQYYEQKLSKVQWPNGKHNTFPSRAVDVAPYPLNWTDREGFERLYVLVMKKAVELGIPIRWGGDWDGDGDRTDQTFNDLVHYELKSS